MVENKVNESVWVTPGFNDPSGWAFTEAPKTMQWPELYGTKVTEKQWVKKKEWLHSQNYINDSLASCATLYLPF